MCYDQSDLLDKNIEKVISKCYINQKNKFRSEILVIYEDGAKEVIYTFNPTKYDFTGNDFVGKTKLHAVFYCDRKKPELYANSR